MNSMRTRKGGGSCETHYCTWENYYTVSSRVYKKYLDSKGLSESTGGNTLRSNPLFIDNEAIDSASP